MALLTLAEFKGSGTYLLNTALFSTDAITSQLILDAEDTYLSIRGKPFKVVPGSYEDEAYIVNGLSDADMQGLAVGMRLSGTAIRGKITDISIDGDITLDAAATSDGTDDTIYVYPEQSLNTAVKIVNYLRRSYVQDMTKESESIEKHSWKNNSQEMLVNGIPRSIAMSIKRLVSVKEGQKTGKGYYKGREEISANDIDVVIYDSDFPGDDIA
jgi:hypothetical protein